MLQRQVGTWQDRLWFSVGCCGRRWGHGRIGCGLVLDATEAVGEVAAHVVV